MVCAIYLGRTGFQQIKTEIKSSDLLPSTELNKTRPA